MKFPHDVSVQVVLPVLCVCVCVCSSRPLKSDHDRSKLLHSQATETDFHLKIPVVVAGQEIGIPCVDLVVREGGWWGGCSTSPKQPANHPHTKPKVYLVSFPFCS